MSSATQLMSRRWPEMAGSPYAGICSRIQCPYSQIQCSKCPGTATLSNVICTTSAQGQCCDVVPSFHRTRPTQDGPPNFVGSDMASTGTAYEVTPPSSSSSYQRFYFRPVQEASRKFSDSHNTTVSGSQMNMIGSLSDSCHQQTIVRLNR